MADVTRRRLLAWAIALPFAAHADERAARLWSELTNGGVTILLRHAHTEPGVGDPPGYRLGNCESQRNLSPTGREQAVRIGEALRARRIKVAAVLSSAWCRCIETARLAFPGQSVATFEALNSFFDDRAAEPERTAALRRRVAAFAGPGSLVGVTHHVNIAALTGEAVAAGEAVLLRADGARVAVLGRLRL
jgi:broad specificity phosphatase PhoE